MIHKARNTVRTLVPIWLFLAGLNGLTAVAASAYSWHDLAGEGLPQKMFEIASANQMFHGLALLAVAWLTSRETGVGRRLAHTAGACFTLGILLFSGTLYWLVLMDSLLVRGAAPFGGFLLMGGWGLFMVIAIINALRPSE